MCACGCACAWALDPDWTLSSWPRYLRLVPMMDFGSWAHHGPASIFCRLLPRENRHTRRREEGGAQRVLCIFGGNYVLRTGGRPGHSPGKEVPSAPCEYPVHTYFGRCHCQVMCETRAGIPSCFYGVAYLLQSWVSRASYKLPPGPGVIQSTRACEIRMDVGLGRATPKCRLLRFSAELTSDMQHSHQGIHRSGDLNGMLPCNSKHETSWSCAAPCCRIRQGDGWRIFCSGHTMPHTGEFATTGGRL